MPNDNEERYYIVVNFMNRPIWLLFIILTVLLFSSTSLLYKAGAIGAEKEKHFCLKYSVCVGTVFFVIAFLYLIIRNEPFTIFESAVRFWPMTIFGFVYAVVNTISFNGYIYNEAMVESPVEGIGGGTSTILLIIAYIVLGRVDSLFNLLTPLRTVGIIVILISIIRLSKIRNLINRENIKLKQKSWMKNSLGTLIFPVMFSVVDALETIVTGVCLDTTYGYAMPEGDSIIIVGMEYAIFAFICYVYIYFKEKKFYNPFSKKGRQIIFGAITDNIGIVFYSYAMAMDSVSTDPLVAVYPIFVMIGGRIFMKEKVSLNQYICLIGIITGSIMVIIDTVI